MIVTPRLVLRRWLPSDLEPFAAMNADPRVMEHFPRTMTRDESSEMIERFEHHFEERGFGLWALEHDRSFIGFTGLAQVRFEAHFTPAVEVGWRLTPTVWGQGFATEAAGAALRVGFTEVGLGEIVSMTIPANRKSIAVMERLGMTRRPEDDFDRPELAERVRRHVLHRITSRQWRDISGGAAPDGWARHIPTL